MELDRVKLSVLNRASRATSGRETRSGGRFLIASRRALAIALAGAVLGSGTAVFAGTGGFKGASSDHSAASSQYRPGKGCGDKNHIHAREDECKKPPK